MPTSLKKLRQTGATVFIHTCEVCGGYAPLGVNVSYLRALKKFGRNDVGAAKELLGKWYCFEHSKDAA